MATMNAIRLDRYEFPGGVNVVSVPRLNPGAGDILVRMKAAGVNSVDWMIAGGYGKEWWGHSLPIVLGCEISGVIEAVGADVDGFEPGDEVYAYVNLSRLGAFAEFVIVQPGELALKPRSVDFSHAAALPVGTLTASQAIFGLAGLDAGQTLLVHAAAGGVGSMAVQLAKAIGARVIGTASARNAEFVRSLGADVVVDYTAAPFEEVVGDVDVVFDLIGGDTQARSIGVLRPGGFLVSAVQPPDQSKLAEAGVRGGMVSVTPDGARLREIAASVDSGVLQATIDSSYPLTAAVAALEKSRAGRTRGKIVLTAEG